MQQSTDRSRQPSELNRVVRHESGGKARTSRGSRTRKALSSGLALGVIGGALMAGAPASQAAIGGGSTGGGGGTGPGAYNYLLLTYDDGSYLPNPAQGWGEDSINAFKEMLKSNPTYQPMQDVDAMGRFDTYIRSSCEAALAQAVARSGVPGARARVVQIGTTMYKGGIDPATGAPDSAWVASWGGATQEFTDWYNSIADAENAANLTGGGWDDAARALVKKTFNDNIIAQPRAVCVAINEFEPAPAGYTLDVQTDKGATFDMAGSTSAVNDVIHASAGASSIRENVNASVSLHWNGPEGQKVVKTKDVAIANNGDTRSPDFTPADFGWTEWPSGGFWFDVTVAKQGKMQGSVDTADNDPRESWTAKPVPPTKVLTHGGATTPLGDSDVLASGMFYDARITANTNGYASSMTITDSIGTDKVFIGAKDKDVEAAAYVLDPAGNKVPNAVIKVDRSVAGTVGVTGTVSNIAAQGSYTLVVPTYVLPTGVDYTIPDTSHVCYTASQKDCLDGNNAQTRKITPAPDKVWVLDEKGALTTADPARTNQQGTDNMVFLPGEAVSAVVNGRVPANLAENLKNYQIVDDWTKAAKYVDFTDASKAKVFLKGVDVTSQFDIKVNGTVTTATAKPEFLEKTKGLGADAPVKLVISGAFKTDYDTNGDTVILHNDGSEVWNNETKETNEPPVYTWTPDPHKQVNGSADESGDNAHSDINGLSVYPGQKLEYAIQLDVRIPQNTARGVKTLAMEDSYDPQFVPDQSSVEFFDSRTNKPIARSAYKLSFDEANHSFKAEFTPEWIAANVTAEGANSEWKDGGWLMARFTGTVKADTVGGSTVKNQAFQIINGVKTATEIPVVKIPKVEPDKEDLNTNLDNIDGKTVVKGDHILYRLTLDGGPSKDKLAYNVHKLGMVDDYDQDYLKLDAAGIKVTSKKTGADVTSKFNIQVKDGVAYVFAKQVDSVNAYGDKIAGDPQPGDLAAYDTAAIEPNTTPIIDQDLLGQEYWITLDTVVTKEVNDYTIKNQARENIQNTNHMTKIVSNPLKDIDPSKDVVVDESSKDASINGQEVKLHSTFNYRLNSSEIPANRAYGASQWSISDTFDRVHDSYTGIWAVYANTDVYDGTKLIFKKGDLLADSAGHESEQYKGLFAATWDEASYTFKVEATEKYLDLVNTRVDLAQSFSVYTKMERIAPGDEIVNKITEGYNKVDRESNIVKTHTPENPAITVVKYTLDEGVDTGDRDDASQALTLTPEQLKTGVKVGFKIKNTGDVPLTNVTFTDAVQEGTFGSAENVSCEVPVPDATKAALDNGSTAKVGDTIKIEASKLKDLAVDQTVDCEGTLTGVQPGQSHTDTVTVTGESVFTKKKVEAKDPWNAKAPAQPAPGQSTPPAPSNPGSSNPAPPAPEQPNAPGAIANGGHQATDADNGFGWLSAAGGLAGLTGLGLLIGFIAQRLRARKATVASGADTNAAEATLGE